MLRPTISNYEGTQKWTRSDIGSKSGEVRLLLASTKSGADRIGSRSDHGSDHGPGHGSDHRSWITLTKIRSFAWPAKMKSAWHNWAQAPLEVFLAQKPHGSDQGPKEETSFEKWNNQIVYKIFSMKTRDVAWHNGVQVHLKAFLPQNSM